MARAPVTTPARPPARLPAPTASGTLRIEYTALSAIQHWPRNPKAHDLGQLSQSFARFGYVNPIIVDETTGRLVAGHGRIDMLLYLKNAGRPAPERIQVRADGEWLVPVLRGIAFPSAHDAEAYLVADNQLTILGGWNDADLYDVLVRQSEANTLDGTGFDGDDLDDLRKRLDADAPPFDPGGDTPDDADTGNTFDVYPMAQVADEVFAHFRRAGFPERWIPLHMRMTEINRLAALRGDPRALVSNYGQLTADSYHPHRLRCAAAQMISPARMFDDDEKFKNAIRVELELGSGSIGVGYFSMMNLSHGTQACANFRPGVAMTYYQRFAPVGGTVLDPCTGYGGRLVGWLASRLGGRYVGVDPNLPTHNGNMQLAADLAPDGHTVTLINQPFEDVTLDDLQVDPESVDFVFTSPPYFAKELYSDAPTQSYQRYRTIDAWTQGFLAPMLATSFAALRTGALCVINVADVKLRNRVFPLVDLTRQCAASAGFVQYADDEEMPMHRHMGAGGLVNRADERQAGTTDTTKMEPVLLFQKPG